MNYDDLVRAYRDLTNMGYADPSDQQAAIMKRQLQIEVARLQAMTGSPCAANPSPPPRLPVPLTNAWAGLTTLEKGYVMALLKHDQPATLPFCDIHKVLDAFPRGYAPNTWIGALRIKLEAALK